MKDDKTQGGGAKRRPLGAPPKAACCLRFGEDFLRFGIISGAHSGSILAKRLDIPRASSPIVANSGHQGIHQSSSFSCDDPFPLAGPARISGCP